MPVNSEGPETGGQVEQPDAVAARLAKLTRLHVGATAVLPRAVLLPALIGVERLEREDLPTKRHVVGAGSAYQRRRVRDGKTKINKKGAQTTTLVTVVLKRAYESTDHTI